MILRINYLDDHLHIMKGQLELHTEIKCHSAVIRKDIDQSRYAKENAAAVISAEGAELLGCND